MPRRKVVWVGRLTGPKRELARRLAYEVFAAFPDLELSVVGGPEVPAEWPAPPTHVRFTGQRGDLDAVYRDADLVIGSGRVALEAMAAGKPVLALGEGCYVGPVGEATIADAKATNFGDCFAPSVIDWDRLGADLERWQRGELGLGTTRYADWLRDYDARHVGAQVRRVYREAIFDARLRHLAEVPILMYHRVTAEPVDGSKFNVYVTRERLRAHFESLRRRGRVPVTFRELSNGRRVRRPVILTFDDGYRDNYEHLLPLLEEFGFKAVIFALGDRRLDHNVWDVDAGEPPAALMSDDELRACQQSGLVEIGSHGLRHTHLPAINDAELQHEVSDSKAALEAATGGEVVSFAYPYGAYGAREVDAVRRAGYLCGIGTVSGPLHAADDPFRIRRIQIMPGDGGFAFWKKSSGWYLRYCRLKGKDF